jgi:stage V sporulation protein D (sporulation-specific penicillin-binding protein)
MLTRSRFFLILFLFLFLIIFLRLFQLQILNHSSSKIFDYLAERKILPERGRIFDRLSNPLVLNNNSYLLYFEPKKIDDPDKMIKKISVILSVDEASLSSKFNKEKDWVAVTIVTKEKKEEIEKLKVSGLGFDYVLRRDYPEASLAAHLLGFVGKNYQGEDIGYFGIEGYYNKDLSGLPGFIQSEKDLLGRPILIGKQEMVEPENGRDLILTIDKNIQGMIKEKLKKGMERYQAESGCVIAADPFSMAILALVCLPDYDPKNYFLFSEEYFRNPAISDLYEPGSVFKPLIMAAALNEKKIKPNDFYNETGPITIGEYSIRTWDNKYEGKISMTRILQKSSNVGMVYVGEKLGDEKLYDYLKKYGFGQPTGIDLQGEVSGYLKPKSQWYPIDFATVTFGQGIAVTPIQMIRAFAALVNGGMIFRPYVVLKIISSEGKQKIIKPKKESQVITNITSQIIKKMLMEVVESGEVKWARPKGYTLGGKTGTAQVPIKGHYDPQKTIASFIGFGPVKEPKFLVLVILRQPKTSPWGSETAAPLFFEIAKELLIYYNIPPDNL